MQCGVGRTGFGFAAERVDVVPDILTTAKSVAAGFPVGAVLMIDAVAERASKGSLGTTFGGGPMACALVETVIDVIESEGLLQHVRNVSSLIRSTCVVGPVKKIQGAGFLLGLVPRIFNYYTKSGSPCVSSVRWAKRAIDSRIWSADLVHLNGFGSSLWASR